VDENETKPRWKEMPVTPLIATQTPLKKMATTNKINVKPTSLTKAQSN
jgi:hypothetical protein